MSNISNKLKKYLKVRSNDPAIKIEKKNIIDLLSYVNNEKIQEFLFNTSTSSLSIKPNDDGIISKLKKTSSFLEFKNLLDIFHIHLTEKDVTLLNNNFLENKINVINNIYNQLAKLNEKFSLAYRTAKKNKENHNIDTLYVGAFFLNGTNIDSNSGSLLNSAIICYPVSLNVNKMGEIILIKDEDPFINEVLIQFLKDNYNIVIDNDFLTTKHENNILSFIKEINELLNNKIPNFEKTDFSLEKFIDYREYLNKSIKIIYSSVVMNMDPNGGIIKKDIDEMMSKGVSDPFEINVDIESKSRYINYQIEKDDLLEINRPLNIYQKYAIQSALKQDTLIYGPPGTGKSEVIANIIANALNKNNTILMSSEKAAALEVILDRLGPLKNLCLFIYNSEDKDKFYDCLRNIINILDDKNINNSNFDQNLDYEKLVSKIINEIEIEFNYWEKYNVEHLLNNLNKEEYSVFKNEFCYQILHNISSSKKYTVHDLVDVIEKIKEIYNQNKDFFNSLLSTNFDMYSESQINQIIEHNNKINNKNDNRNFWYKLLNNNKIKTKCSLIQKIIRKKQIINIDLNNLSNLLEQLAKLNLKISKNDIQTIVQNCFKFTNLLDLCKWFEFEEFLVKNNYYSETLNDALNRYKKIKERISKENATKIFNNYCVYLKNSFNKLDIRDKKEIIECLNKSNLQKKWDINKLIKRYKWVFKFLFPVWILSPKKTCSLIELKENVFDYGIFDEASQMFVEDSYPLIYRCKISIIAGDSNQMPPSNWFNKNSDFGEEDVDQEIAESLLEKAESLGWPTFHLKNHYRSKSAELIAFSNENIYDDSLEFFTQNGINNKPISVINVNGLWNDSVNDDEAKEILNIIQKTHIEYKNKKILIITFNSDQSKHLENLFIDRFINTDIFAKYQQGMISIKNLENVQGDEGDISIISVSYGKNTNDKVRQNFGVLSRADGYKRLNVAVTRAKEKMIIVKSLSSSEINNTSNKSTLLFKKFIDYVDTIQNKKNIPIKKWDIKFDSDFEENVYNNLINYLDKEKFALLTQYSVGKKRIDMVVYSLESKGIILGIEIDGLKYHSDIRKKIEDLDRQIFLENLGYRMYRILEIEWKMNKHQVINNILTIIKKHLNKNCK